jgi:hypothetical protein
MRETKLDERSPGGHGQRITQGIRRTRHEPAPTPRHPDTLDPDVASDLRAFGDAACRDLPDLATTRRELQAALAQRLPARRRSGLLRSPRAGALAHLELTWSSVYAMARDRLLRIDVALEGKTDEEAAAEIRLQLAEHGWTPTAVNVSRDADTIVHLSAEDEAGRQLRFLQRRLGRSRTTSR